MGRPFAEVRRLLSFAARDQRDPFEDVDPEAIERALDTLDSVAPEPWVEAFGALAEPHMRAAAQAERSGDIATAAREYFRAYAYWRVAHYPVPTSAPKREA